MPGDCGMHGAGKGWGTGNVCVLCVCVCIYTSQGSWLHKNIQKSLPGQTKDLSLPGILCPGYHIKNKNRKTCMAFFPDTQSGYSSTFEILSARNFLRHMWFLHIYQLPKVFPPVSFSSVPWTYCGTLYSVITPPVQALVLEKMVLPISEHPHHVTLYTYCWALLFLFLSCRLEHPAMVSHCSFWSSSIVDQVLKLSSGPCLVKLHPFCEEKTRTAQIIHHMDQSLICT